MLEYIFDLIAPHSCLGCGTEGSLLCPLCTDALPSPADACYRCGRKTDRYLCASCAKLVSLDRVIARTRYDGVAKELVHRLKFVRAAAGARIIAMAMSKELAGFRDSNATISYAPTASGRIRIRGYDQSRLIAKHLSQILHLPCRPLLLRIGQMRQVGASKGQRVIQSRHAFVVRPRITVPKTEIILIDDVITTGSTLEAAAAVLREAGSGPVIAAVFASSTKQLANHR
jgi:competence protein ComFC